MLPYTRKVASFALCGLNCCLCPRFHTDGPSRCPGCGGPDFASKHPTCAVITCSMKHGSVEYCFECKEYPCKRYSTIGNVDSFISYQNVIRDLSLAKQNLDQYLKVLSEKHQILVRLISDYDDGRSKGFYCLAVNLLPLSELTIILDEIKSIRNSPDTDKKENVKQIREIFESHARKLGIVLILRK